MDLIIIIVFLIISLIILQIVYDINFKKIKEIAEIKLPDLNAYTVEEAMKIVEGTALNMGIKVSE